MARAIAATARVCAICGEPPRPGDEFVADHIVPHAHGGPSVASNLQAAHRSCNGKKAANLTNSRHY